MATSIPNVSFPYISIKLSNINLTWRGNAPDYFTSLTCNRYISKATTGTVNITYAPGPNDDPNAVEEALIKSKGDALIRYGQVNCFTRLQRAMIYDYRVTMNEGVFQYSLDFVSRSAIYNFDKVATKTFNKDSPKDEVLKWMKEVIELIKVNDQQAYEFKQNGLDFEFTKDVTVGNDLSPFEALLTVTKEMKDPSDSENRYYYTIEVDDSFSGLGRVYLRKVDTKQKSAEFTFNWGTKDSDIIDWSIDYKGAVALSAARGNSEYITIGINEATGKMVTTVGTTPTVSRMADTPDSLGNITDMDWNSKIWTEHAKHSYTAKLTVLGQGTTLSVGESVVQVNPMVHGKAHHSKGRYKITGVTDTISASGFQTTYSMYRITDEDQVIYPTKDTGKFQIYYNGAVHTYDETGWLYEK